MPDLPQNEVQSSPLRRFLQLIGLSPQPDTTEELEQEIQELIDEGEEHGLISSQEGRMISSIFDFRDTLVLEVMTPATEIISAPMDAPHCDIIKLVLDNGYSRIPVYKENPDNIVGIVHAKDLLSCPAGTPMLPLKKLLHPPLFAQESDQVVTILQEFQKQKKHIAIVTDEFSTVRGLVTLEDILEEIVGEIADESDKETEEWQVIDERTLIISAKADIEKIETYFNLTLAKGPYESVGGFIIHQLGRIPGPDTSIRWEQLTFQVLSANERQIKTVKIHRLNP